jgi:hypothetical protein
MGRKLGLGERNILIRDPGSHYRVVPSCLDRPADFINPHVSLHSTELDIISAPPPSSIRLTRALDDFIVAGMTAAELIKALGGGATVANHLGVTRQAVSNWSTWGSLPPRHYLRIKALAQTVGAGWDDSLFREVTRDEKTLARSEHATQAQDR